jgi:predicted ATPase
LPQWLALGERCKGWAMHQLGDLAAGLALQQNGVKRWYETGAMLHTTHCEIILAKSYLREGCTTEARSCLSAARSHRAQYGEDYLAAEIERLEALLLHLEGANFDIIDEHLTKALTIARAQEARLLELRSATMLARMLAETGDRRRAIDLLAPIYGWFTEGFDTTDLREAKAVLDKLS